MSNVNEKYAARQEVRRVITSRFGPGDQLPAEKDLAVALNVSRNMLREVLEELQATGIVVRKWGLGTFMNHPGLHLQTNFAELRPIPELIRQQGHDCELTHSHIARRPADDEVASELQVVPGTQTWHLERAFAVDGVNAVYIEDWVLAERDGRPYEFTEIGESLLDLLERSGQPLHYTLSTLGAVACGEAVANVLGIGAATPVLLDKNIGYSETGDPVSTTRSYWLTDVVSVEIVRYRRR